MNFDSLEAMIKGKQMPHLIDNDKPDDLIHQILQFENTNYFDELYECRASIGNGIFLDITLKDKADLYTDSFYKPALLKVIKEMSSIDFKELEPAPPDNKGYCYYYLIIRRRKILTDEINELLNSSYPPKDMYFIVHRDISRLKILGNQLGQYQLEHIQKTDENDLSIESNAYVVDLLKNTLTNLIIYYQTVFSWVPRIKRQTKIELHAELFSGKPLIFDKKTFKDFLICDDKEKLIENLKVIYSGKKGKNIATMILALLKNNMIVFTENEELYNVIREIFGDIGSTSGLNKYLSPSKNGAKETLIAEEIIKKHAEIIKNAVAS